MSDIDIDLDALAPRAGTLKYKGKEIPILPPITRDLFEGASLIDKLAETDALEDTQEAYDNVGAFFKRLIPDLDEQLSIYQYRKLYEKLQELTVPADNKALQEAGISIVDDGDSKKDEPNTQEK